MLSGQRGCLEGEEGERLRDRDRRRERDVVQLLRRPCRVTRVTSCLCSFSLRFRGREKRRRNGEEGRSGGNQKGRNANKKKIIGWLKEKMFSVMTLSIDWLFCCFFSSSGAILVGCSWTAGY